MRHDVPRALDESRRAWRLAPKDARFLAVVGQNELALGHREEGLAHLRAALVLDPRSVENAIRAAFTLTGLRQYAEALQVVERARALAPANLLVIHATVRAHIAQGDLAGARAVLRGVPREVDPAALVAITANWDDLTGSWTTSSSGCCSGSPPLPSVAIAPSGPSPWRRPTRCEATRPGREPTPTRCGSCTKPDFRTYLRMP